MVARHIKHIVGGLPHNIGLHSRGYKSLSSSLLRVQARRRQEQSHRSLERNLTSRSLRILVQSRFFFAGLQV